MPGTNNITDDPLFADGTNFDFNLTEDSPCIDAGDPACIYDPDGTIADIGALFYEQENSVEDFAGAADLRDFVLNAPYPNPFNNETTISFQLQTACRVELKVFDITGRSVGVQNFEPLHKWMNAGEHEVVWNAEGMTSGVYFVRLTVDRGHLTDVRKAVLVK